MLNRDPLHTVDDADVAAFERDGAVCLRDLFDAEWIDLLRDAVDADKTAPGPMVRHNTPAGQPGEFFVDFQLWQRWPAVRVVGLSSAYNRVVSAVSGWKASASGTAVCISKASS